MRGITQTSKSLSEFFPFNFTTCPSHKDKWAIYDVRQGLNALVDRGLSFDAALSACKQRNGVAEQVPTNIDADDLYPVQIVLFGNDWKATNHLTGEVSANGFNSRKDALPSAYELFSKWINVHKCVAA